MHGAETHDGLFKPGLNCWRVVSSTRTAVLVDAKEYFQAVAFVVEKAKESVFILGWDIDSRIRLCPDFSEDSHHWAREASRPLADFLLHLLHEKPRLHIYILSWDFAHIYDNERERRRETHSRFSSHPRMHFAFDNFAPFLSSHHQKVVVVDDQAAFCGGLDLTQRRWDTNDHRLHDHRRKDPTGKHYGPFHDVQIMVEGEAAQSLGELARSRWKTAMGEEPVVALLPTEKSRVRELWPPFVRDFIADYKVAISRTYPEYRHQEEVRENERLFLDMFEKARNYIYIENQYFTSSKLGELIKRKLREIRGPEIFIVVRFASSKWVEAISVAILRARLIRDLKKNDLHGRLHILCPYASVREDRCVNLHSKVLIIDNRWLRVGSSNLCGRSMGLDTECDISLEATSDESRAYITRLRNRLLAEHLGSRPEKIAKQLKQEKSLAAVLYSHRENDRNLVPCPERAPFHLDRVFPGPSIVDPDHPLRMRNLGTTLLGLIFLAMVLAVLHHKFGGLFTTENLARLTNWIHSQPLTPVVAIAGVYLLTLFFIPLLPLTLAVSLVFSAPETIAYVLTGAWLTSLTVYFFARKWRNKDEGHFLFRWLRNEKVQAALKAIHKQGIWPVAMVRMFPFAPFWIVNFWMGAGGAHFFPFAFGTLIGLIPGTLLIAFLGDRVASLGWVLNTGVWLAALIALGLGWLLQRTLKKWTFTSGKGNFTAHSSNI